MKFIETIGIFIKKSYFISKMAIKVFDTLSGEDFKGLNITPKQPETILSDKKENLNKTIIYHLLREVNRMHSNWRINVIFCVAISCLFITMCVLLYFMGSISREVKALLKYSVRWLVRILTEILFKDLARLILD